MARKIHDHYFREAKREGYRSRAAYKLMEIDDRRKLLHPGDRVLDCGCAPGSWLQVAAERVGPKGVVVGVDLQPLPQPLPSPNVHSLVGDLRQVEPSRLLALAGGEDHTRCFDVVLSDMAPSTTGDRSSDHHQSIRLCEAVLERCDQLLRPGGRLVMKVLEGEAYALLLQRTKRCFERVKGFKPKSSRTESTEMYILAEGFRGPARGNDEQGSAPSESLPEGFSLPPRRPAPPTGWGA